MEPTLDNWTTIFLIAAAQGVMLFFLFLLNKHWKQTKNKLLAGIVFSFSLMLFYYVTFWTKVLPSLPRQVHILGELTYVIAPLTLLYLRRFSGYSLRKSDWSHFIPFAVVGGTLLLDWYRFGAVIQNIQLVIYAFLIWYEVNKNSSELKWRKLVAVSYSVFAGGTLLYYVLVWTFLLKIEYDYWISASMTFFIYFVGYKAILNQKLLRENKPATKYEKSLISSEAALSVSQKIIQHIETNRIYTNGEYKLSDLADDLSIPSHTISQVLNVKLKKSFNDLINGYRIREAKRLLREQENESIISIAYSVGFNNKVSFNTSFKKHTGFTPTEFRNARVMDISLN